MRRKRSDVRALLFDDGGMIHPRILRMIDRTPGAVLLETTRRDRRNHRTFLFFQPTDIITCSALDEVEGALGYLDAVVRHGLYAAGFLTYEAGYAFERALKAPARLPEPLLWFGVYEDPIIFNHATDTLESGDVDRLSELHDGVPADEAEQIGTVTPSISESFYEQSISRIKKHLVDGDTYQVNFTFKLRFEFKGSSAQLYARLRRRQRVGYAAFINTGEERILSLSPEMFFRRSGSVITLKPMKGTAPRGRTLEEDEEQVFFLRTSEKNKAENLMIVDLLRNDVGRIAVQGSVRVPRFFDIEKYETVFQATSTIQARLKPRTGVREIMHALFPSGSVTGAPKIRTMQIIESLENEPRGIYTGAIGYWAPRRKAMFNVAIRTVVLRSDGRGEMGVGSGVVIDSVAHSEYQECLLKGKFLTEAPSEFKLIETIRWNSQSGWFLLPQHIRRLRSSACYFDVLLDEKVLLQELKTVSRSLRATYRPEEQVRVRLLCDRNGRLEIEHRPLLPLVGVQRAYISCAAINSNDRFLFHKTTNRGLYDAELEQCRREGFFDAMFVNEKHELTEGARSNIVVLIDGKLYTPPVICGLLPGTFRAHLLEEGKAQEKVLTLEDAKSAQRIYLCNALYGLVPVSLVERNVKGSSYAQPMALEN